MLSPYRRVAPRSKSTSGLSVAARVINVVPAKITATAAASAVIAAAVARDARVLPASTSCHRPGILLAAQDAGCREDRPERADGGEEDEALVDGVSPDAADRSHRPEQDRETLVGAGRGHELVPAGRRAEAAGVRQRGRRGRVLRTRSRTVMRRSRAAGRCGPRPPRPHRRKPIRDAGGPVVRQSLSRAVRRRVGARAVSVVGHEELLQRGLPSGDVLETRRSQRGEQRLHRARHVTLDRSSVDPDVADAGNAREVGGRIPGRPPGRAPRRGRAARRAGRSR